MTGPWFVVFLNVNVSECVWRLRMYSADGVRGVSWRIENGSGISSSKSQDGIIIPKRLESG